MSAKRGGNGLWVLLRSIVLWIFLGTFTISVAAVANVLALLRLRAAVHRLAVFWAYTMASVMGMRLEVENVERLHQDGPVIIVANHQSMTDVLCFYIGLPKRFYWMAKASLFRIPIFGWAMRGAGHIPVVRDNRRRAMDSLFEAAEKIAGGKSVIIFPEGTRSETDGTMQPFKKGSFILAKKANVAIQPVSIWGASSIVPVQGGRWIQRMYPGRARIVVHEAILPEEYKDWSPEELSDRVRKTIERPFDRLRVFSEILG